MDKIFLQINQICQPLTKRQKWSVENIWRFQTSNQYILDNDERLKIKKIFCQLISYDLLIFPISLCLKIFLKIDFQIYIFSSFNNQLHFNGFDDLSAISVLSFWHIKYTITTSFLSFNQCAKNISCGKVCLLISMRPIVNIPQAAGD